MTAVDFSRVAVDRGRRLTDHHGVDVDWVVACGVDHSRRHRAHCQPALTLP